jgi:hypothetical protein
MIEVMNGYQDDQATLEMIAKLSIDPVAIPGFSLHNGILKLHTGFGLGLILLFKINC